MVQWVDLDTTDIDETEEEVGVESADNDDAVEYEE